MVDVASLGLKVDSSGMVRASKDLRRFEDSAGRAERAGTSMGGAVTSAMKRAAVAAAAAAGAAASIGQSIRVISEFGSSMSQVSAITRATSADLERMRDIAKELGSTTEFTASQAADGLRFLGMAGFSAAEGVAAIPSVLDLATAASMDLATAADTASNIMSAFGIAAKDAADVSDVLAAAASRANTDVTQLGDAMAYVGPVASSLDIAMSDAAAAVGVLSDAGIQGSSAGTGLRRVLSSLANPTTKAADTLRSLGVSLESVNPQTNSLTDVVDRLSGVSLTAADALTIFGDRGGPAILALTSQTDRLSELTGELSDVDGEAKRMADTMRDNLSGDIKTLMSSVEGLILSLGEAGLTAILRGLVKAATAVARAFTAIVEEASALTTEFRAYIQNITSFGDGTIMAQQAVDNLTLAMGDELQQVQLLTREMVPGAEMSREMAAAKLDEAKAHLAAVDAKREERLEQVRNTSAYKEAAREAARAREAIQQSLETSFNSRTLGILPRETEAWVAKLGEAQQEMQEILGQAGKVSPEYVAAREEVERIAKAIAAASGETVDFNEEITGGVVLSERMRVALGNIGATLSGAASGASVLAQMLQGAANMAVSLYNRVVDVMNALPSLGAGLSRLGGIGAAVGASLEAIPSAFGAIANSDAVSAAGRVLAETGNYLKGTYQAFVRSAGAMDEAGSSAGGAASEVDKLADKIQQLEFDADPVKKYNAEIAQLDKLLEEGLSQGAYDHAVEKLNEELADAIPMVSDVSDAFGEWVARGFKDFEGFVGSIWRSFQGLLADMISAAARNRILFSMGIGGGAAGSAASAAGAAAGGGGSGGGILGGLLGGGGGMLGTFGSAAAGTVGTGLIGGFGNAMGIGAGSFSPFAIGANAAMAGGGFMATLGAALPVIGLVAGAISLFVGKTKELDRGLRVTIDGMDSLVEQFRRTETSRLFGLIKSRDTDYSRASAEVADPIIAMVGQIQTGVLGMSESLGIGAQAFEDFSTQVKVSTKGLSEEEAQKAIEEAFRGMADEMAELALEGRGVIRVGEGASEALERLSNALAATNRVFDTLGHEMYEASVSGADMASSLVDLFGGLDSFNSATTRFFEVAYSEAERMEIATRQAREALAEFNVALPASRAAYRQLVESLDLGTTRGRELYAVLVGMADTMDRILPQAQTFTDAIAGLFSQTNSAIQVMINEAQGAAREAGQAAQDWFRAADTLRDFITDLTRASDTALSPDQQMRALSRDYRETFSAARGGDVDAAREFPQAADAFLEAARGQANTALEFRRIESRVRAQANLLAGISELEGAGRTVAEDLALQQVEVLNELNDYMQSTDNLKPEDLAGFENRLGALQSAIEHVEMINYDFLKKRLDVAVDLLPEADIPADVAKLISTAANGIDSTIEFAVRAADLTPDLRWLALTGASEHIAGLQFIIEKDLPNDLRRLATTEIAELTRDVRFAVGQDLPQDLKRIALIQNANVSRTVTAALGEADPLAIRTALAESDTVQRVFNAVMRTGKLTPQQRSLLTAISGAQPGILQLRGGFQFDPSSAFSNWYESTTRDAIANPMAQLRSSLDSLRDAMEKQARVDAINSYVSSLPTTGDGTYIATGSQIHDDLAGMLGLNPNQNTYDLASKIAGMSGMDNLDNLAVYDGATRKKLLDQIDDPALQVNPEAYLRRRKDVASHPVYGDDPQAHWEDYGRDLMLSGVTSWFHPDMFDFSTIDLPAFAAGGMHTGGLRMVGERGPELEATGPARYYSASQTRSMLAGGDVVAELRRVHAALAAIHDQNKQFGLRADEQRRDIRKNTRPLRDGTLASAIGEEIS